jgi:transcriptional regulator with GAF, ATPase, and Fis domain
MEEAPTMTTMPNSSRFTSPLPSLNGAPTGELREATLSCPDLHQILPAIEPVLQKMMPHDYAAIALRDEKTGHLRLRELSAGCAAESVQVALLPSERTPAGWALTQQKPLLVSTIHLKQFSKVSDGLPDGMLFGCWIPLRRRGQAIGVLFVGSRHDAHFEKRALDLLALSPEVAGAIELTESVQQLADSTDKLREEKSYLEDQLRSEWRFENIIGMSNGFRTVMEQVRRVAPSGQTVLIRGENGTEKELIARLIHELSLRNREIFVKVRCAGEAAEILAGKLFGSEKESLGGIGSRRLGRLELAHGGTLFMEEIADLPTELQSRLLLGLREGQPERVEGQGRIRLDIRLLASTSRDLSALVSAGGFNKDLYRLLTVAPIHLLPLRDRSSDIPLLVGHFVSKFARQMNKTINIVPPETMSILCASQWPGNVRELENFIERAVMLTHGCTLRAPMSELEALPDESLQAAERKHILRILRDTRGVIGGSRGAAKRLDVKRTTLNSKLKKLGIEREVY